MLLYGLNESSWAALQTVESSDGESWGIKSKGSVSMGQSVKNRKISSAKKNFSRIFVEITCFDLYILFCETSYSFMLFRGQISHE